MSPPKRRLHHATPQHLMLVPTPAAPHKSQAGPGIDIGRELTKGFAAGLIREKSKQIARRAGFSKSDVDDLQQQFIGHVLENWRLSTRHRATSMSS